MQAKLDLSECARILVTGGTGQVGSELINMLNPLGEIVAPGRKDMDLADVNSVRQTIRSVRPRWILNSGAYTSVDKAESEPELAYAINAEAVRVIGEEARRIDAGIIHFSTDYVFDGTGERAYVETDLAKPVSVYGASKLAGEQALAESGAPYMVFRTSWVYGGTGKNFLLTILKLARERQTLRVVADQHGAPTWSRNLAQLAVHVIRHCEDVCGNARPGMVEKLADIGGLYHAAGSGETTWHGFAAEAIRLQRKREPNNCFAEIDPIATADYPTPARRPANSRLNCEKLAKNFGWKMMEWHESLQKVLSEL